MCGGPEHSKPRVIQDNRATGPEEGNDVQKGMGEKQPSKMKETSESCSRLLELAANNDLTGFKQVLEEDGLSVNEASFWYGRQNGSKQKMVFQQRTPAMVAALYGSLDVLNYILTGDVSSGVDINQGCGSDMSTALHCAAAGGSIFAIEIVKLLIESGADVNRLDAYGRKPVDVIMISPKLPHVKIALEKMLMGLSSPMKIPCRASGSEFCLSEDSCLCDEHAHFNGKEFVSMSTSRPPSSPPEASSPTSFGTSLSSSPKFSELTKSFGDGSEKREYAIDPSLPDIKNSIYSTDEFRMFSFKVRPCSRAYSHDWTECPFVHPGENARRRDPRRYHYSCVPCPDFRKGACRRGDVCEYAHGVFECWLHPAQYRTRLCKDGTNCSRRVCFFAHKAEELRPLYVSTGSAMPSQRTPSSLDMTSAMNPLPPGSPSSVLLMSPFSPSNPSQNSLPTPPMSPSSASANSPGHSSFTGSWAQPNVPALHLSNGCLQASRLRAAVNARDVTLDDLTRSCDYEGQLVNEFASLSSQPKINVAAAIVSGGGNASSRSGKCRSHGLATVAPTNLEDLFASEILSPRTSAPEPPFPSQMQSFKVTQLHPRVQHQMQSSFNTQAFPQGSTQTQLHMQQGAVDCQSPGLFLPQSPVQSSYNLSSLGPSSSLSVNLERQNSNGSPLSPVMTAAINSRAAAFAQREMRSYSSRELGANASWSDWGSPTGKVDWGVQGEELSKLRKSASFRFRNFDEPDLSWVQSLVKDVPVESVDGGTAGCSVETFDNVKTDSVEMGTWMEQKNPDQMAPLTL